MVGKNEASARLVRELEAKLAAAHEDLRRLRLEQPSSVALLDVLHEAARHYGVSVERTTGELAERMRDGLRRPGSWEAQPVGALLSGLAYGKGLPYPKREG